jgi:hypothetical protein
VSARIETISVVLIALAVLTGGRYLLGALVLHHVAATLVLVVLLIVQFLALRRNYAQDGSSVHIRATRDVAFLVTILLALALVASPQRWSIGATIAALEFGLVLDLLARFTPDPG